MFPAICWVVFSIATALNNPVIKMDHTTVQNMSEDRRLSVSGLPFNREYDQ